MYKYSCTSNMNGFNFIIETKKTHKQLYQPNLQQNLPNLMEANETISST